MHVPTSSALKAEGVLVAAVAAGGEHSVFVDRSGVVYSCGRGDRGQTGHPRSALKPMPGGVLCATRPTVVDEPLKLAGMRDPIIRVAAAACGARTT